MLLSYNTKHIFISPGRQKKIDVLSEKYHDKLEKFFKHFEVKEHLEQEREKKSDYETFTLFISFILNALKDREFYNFIYESYEIGMDNFYETILANPLVLIDKKFFEFAINEIKRIEKSHEEETAQIILEYLKILSEKIHVQEVYNSLLIERDRKHKKQLDFLTHSIDEFFEQKSEDFTDIIDAASKKNYRIYIFDLLLKYGYLLEAHTKNILLFFLKLYHIDKVLKYEYLKQNKLMIGKILEYYKKYNIYLDSFFNNYRNAIFHSNFIINYDVKLEERKVSFVSQGKIINLTVKDLLFYFFQIYYLIFTFELVIVSILPKEILLSQLKEFLHTVNELLVSIPIISGS